jgi:myo-inositol-1(or 4)-monophosphatase
LPNKNLPLVGRLDAYVGGALEPWDMAAGVIIVREAGGEVTTLDGKYWTVDQPSILAANPKLHKKLYHHLNQ